MTDKPSARTSKPDFYFKDLPKGDKEPEIKRQEVLVTNKLEEDRSKDNE